MISIIQISVTIYREFKYCQDSVIINVYFHHLYLCVRRALPYFTMSVCVFCVCACVCVCVRACVRACVCIPNTCIHAYITAILLFSNHVRIHTKLYIFHPLLGMEEQGLIGAPGPSASFSSTSRYREIERFLNSGAVVDLFQYCNLQNDAILGELFNKSIINREQQQKMMSESVQVTANKIVREALLKDPSEKNWKRLVKYSREVNQTQTRNWPRELQLSFNQVHIYIMNVSYAAVIVCILCVCFLWLICYIPHSCSMY